MIDAAVALVVGLSALGWAVFLLTGPVACWRMRSWRQRLPFLLWFAGFAYLAFLVPPSPLRTAALWAPFLAAAAELIRQARVRRSRLDP